MQKVIDVAIVGAGTAGMTALKEVTKVTQNYLLIEEGPFGTTCARVGCMPSKVFIQIANDFHRRTHFSPRGIQGGNRLTFDSAAALRYVRKMRDRFVKSTLASLDRKDPRVLKGRAKLVGPNELQVGHRRYRAERIILATGSTPYVPKEWPDLGKRLLTTDTLFELKKLPRRIAVVGWGAIGMEMGQALSRLGCEVVAFSHSPRIAGLSDPKVNQAARKALGKSLRLKVGGKARVTLTKQGVKVAGQTFDAVLACMGRPPQIAGLGLETLGVPLRENGLPEIDVETAQVKGTSVFIAGDADGHRGVLHEASDDGYRAGYNSVRPNVTALPRRCALAITFCEPNIAIVGTPFSEQRDFVTGEIDFSDQGRSKILGENQGRLHVYFDKLTQRITGAEMAAPRGEHMAHLLAWCVQRGLTLPEMLAMPFYHPVVEEGLRTALRHAASQWPE